MMEFDEFAELIARAAKEVRPQLAKDAAEIGAFQREIAVNELIGHESANWTPLADSTIEEKERLGYTGRVSATDPLLRKGEMRDSIQFEVEPTGIGVDMTLGSHDKVAIYQEIGTPTIPPRPFLARSALLSLKFAEEQLSKTIPKVLSLGR